MFPRVEFPLHASAQQASGRPRQYLDPRTNAVGTGSFSAAVVDDDGALAFRRQVRGRYVHYHTPCLPLTRPNIRTPYDMVTAGRTPSLMSQITFFQWNYKDVYIPPHLLHDLLTETTAVEQQNAEYDPLLGSVIAFLPPLSPSSPALLFFASGPLLQTLSCGVVRQRGISLALTESDAYQMPGRIMEVQATRTQGKVFVCARTTYHAAFFLGPLEEAVSSALEEVTGQQRETVSEQLLTLLAIFQTDYCIASMTLSPYIAGEGLVVVETGGVYLWCQGQPLQVLQRPLATPSSSSPAHFWRCCYGSHPRSLVLAEHSGVSLGDFRSNHLHFSPLLTCPSEWIPENTLISSLSTSSPSHPHQLHISTSHSLLLLDTRQPGWPLLQESHDLSHAPQIMDTTSTHDGHCILNNMFITPPTDTPTSCCVHHTTTNCRAVILSCSHSSRASHVSPPHSSSAAHTVANYGDLEDQWQGKSALPLLGNRLQLPLVGACLFKLGENTEDRGERYGAITMSVLGDLFYQLWSYGETPPTDTPTSCDESWLQEAWLQEQELQMSREEWTATSSPVTFKPLLEYLQSPCYPALCPACLAVMTTHFPASLPPYLRHPVTPSHSQTIPLLMRCAYCRGRLAPLQARRLEQKSVAEGLMSGCAEEGEVTMATVQGLERLRASCNLTDPGVDGNHDDQIFWEGWREGEGNLEDSEALVTSPPARSQTSVQEKPYTPTKAKRDKTKKMGF